MRSSLAILVALAALVALATLASGCTWETDLPTEATSIPVVADRELLVTDDAILAPLSRNADGAALSYRHVTERLPLADGGATLRWLEAWARVLDGDASSDRARALTDKAICSWMKSAPANACDATCATCAARALPLEAAPFRLIAVANRTDLSVMPDRAADGGEGRLVYALTDGPADDPRSHALPLTVILEYAQWGSALEWTQRWHALGEVPSAEGPHALAALAGRFVEEGALAQVRTADALGGPLILHQFALDHGELVPTNVRNTPDFAHVPAAAIKAWAHDNAPSIADGTAVMPRSWWAASSAPDDRAPEWVSALPEHDSFVRASCGGCHAQSDSGFQIDPLALGKARLSRFLSDPTQSSDELRRRTEWMQLTLWKH
jgi:hypothetical protein